MKPVYACLKDAGIDASKINELVLVGGMTRMPKVIETARQLINKEPHKGVNPDEVVAMGAALQGGVLSGEVKDLLLLDVTPLTLAIETAGGVATAMIPRNTTIPSRKTQIFSTYSDNQPAVDIVIVQGERSRVADNKQLGNFKLEGIEPAPRGTPQIEITFDLDANGILNVSAKDLKTEKQHKITITGSSGLSKEDIDRMQQEAEQYAEQDKQYKELAEAKNIADNTIYQAEKQLQETDEAESKQKLEQSIAGLRSTLLQEKAEDILQVATKLQTLIAEALAAKTQTTNASTEADVVDVEAESVVNGSP
jgi:molecular chaperone DnaK